MSDGATRTEASRLRILHVMPWLARRYGGPSAAVPAAAAALRARGHDVEVVATNADGPDRLSVVTGIRAPWSGIDATFHPVSWPSRYLTSWPLAADLIRRAGEFDVLHVHSLYRFHGVAAAVAARAHGVPYVVQPHGSLDPWHRARRALAKDVYHAVLEDSIIRGAAAVIATSEREFSSIRALGYRVPVWVLPNGVDLPPGDVVPDDGASPVRRQEPLVTFLGRISEKKGVPILVEAFALAARHIPGARLVIAGPDDEGIAVRASGLASQLGVAGRIQFPGLLDVAARWELLGRSSVFVLPSADESFGVAVAEAMAAGCPVVITPEVAIATDVAAAGAGFVVDRAPGAVGDAVCRILASPPLAASMGRAGRTLVEDRFAWSRVAPLHEAMYAAVAARREQRPRAGRSARRLVRAPGIDHERLACPACRRPVEAVPSGWRCASCGRRYGVEDGIPVLLVVADQASHDELEHHAPQPLGRSGHERAVDAHKHAQASHFDRAVAAEHEITRPHGAPAAFRFLIGEKLRRAIAPVGPHLVGASALTVCGGSGMDAECLARAGARVVTTDISLGAARRARERAQRYGLDITSVVADVERLPFPDRSFDLVLVHDGLHHLEDPEAALREMTRVARRWVSITEPAKAAATSLAIKVGAAAEYEQSGNRVIRFGVRDVVTAVTDAGFRPVVAERYAMFYRHEPGPVSRVLSRRGVLPAARASWRIANALVGRRLGNKLVVVAERVGH